MNKQAVPQGGIEQGTLLIEIATRNVICLAPGDNVGTAAHIMAEKRISSLVVVDEEGHPAGIVTERNILQAMHSGCAPEMALSKVMSAPVITVPESISCLDAYQICLRDSIRHLVIVDADKRLLGVVSETDFRLHINLTTLAGHRQVGSVMNSSVFGLAPEAGLQEALNLMQSHRNSCVVVVENERPLGIITERDIVRLYSGKPEHSGIQVREIMTSPVLTIPSDSTINLAAGRMLAARVRHLVVVDDTGRMAGLLSEHELTHAMTLGLIDSKINAEGAFLHTLVNTIPDLIWLKDVNGVYLACNPRFECFFGAKAKDIVGKTDYDFMSHELAEHFRGNDRKTMEQNVPCVNERWVTFADDGHRELLETIKTPMRDSQGKLIGVLGIARDITKRGQLEEQLKESQKKFHNIFESASDCIELISMDGRIIDLNHVGYERLGYAKEEMQGKPLAEFGIPEYADRVQERAKLIKSQGSATFESARLRKDGSIMPIEVNSRLVELDGQPMFLSVSRDITERKRVEEERRRLSAALMQSDEPVALTDDGTRYIYANPAFCKLFGYELKELLGNSISLLMPPEDISGMTFRQTIATSLELGAFQGEVRRRAKDGTIIPILLKVSPFRDELGGLMGHIATMTDLTEIKRMEYALRESEKHFRDMIEHAPLGTVAATLDGHFIDVNKAFCDIVGYPKEALKNLSFGAITHPDDINVSLENIQKLRDGRINSYRIEKRYFHRDGHVVWAQVDTSPQRGLSGEPQCLICQIEDIAKSKAAEENLRITASVFDNTQEAILITDANNAIVDVNPAFTHITGYSREEVLGRNPKLLSSGRQDKAFYTAMWQSLKKKKAWRGEIWNRRKSGEVYAELLSISAIYDDDGGVKRYVGVFSDISYLKEHEAELSRVANYDALTGVPNRRLLADRLRQAIVRAQRSGKMLAICYIDLDGFKQVNDLYGHEAGDQLLVNITFRLQEALRAGDTLARLGGDEFVVLFNDLVREQECLQVLDRILDIVAMPVVVGSREVMVSASIGVTFYPSDHEDGDTLLRHADQAMYVAKQTGKNRYHLYDAEHDQRVRSLHESRRRILQGLEKGEFELFYQPKIELVSGAVVGVEALIRWHHPERGLLLPAEFLPFIEDSDLEIRLGEWVMDTALAQIDVWYKEGLVLEVSINISARHLQSPDFVAGLALRLARYPDLPRDKLQIEVLETAALEDIPQSAETIEACRKLGVNFALDDFGTGYSSLAYLRKLSAETLKIDQSFVRGMLTDEGDRAIVQGIIALAKTFGRKTVAEGMEAADLIRVLIEVGCMYGQGYGIARPMPSGDFRKWHKERQ